MSMCMILCERITQQSSKQERKFTFTFTLLFAGPCLPKKKGRQRALISTLSGFLKLLKTKLTFLSLS